MDDLFLAVNFFENWARKTNFLKIISYVDEYSFRVQLLSTCTRRVTMFEYIFYCLMSFEYTFEYIKGLTLYSSIEIFWVSDEYKGICTRRSEGTGEYKDFLELMDLWSSNRSVEGKKKCCSRWNSWFVIVHYLIILLSCRQ